MKHKIRCEFIGDSGRTYTYWVHAYTIEEAIKLATEKCRRSGNDISDNAELWSIEYSELGNTHKSFYMWV